MDKIKRLSIAFVLCVALGLSAGCDTLSFGVKKDDEGVWVGARFNTEEAKAAVADAIGYDPVNDPGYSGNR